MPDRTKSPKKTVVRASFTEEERAAMRERAQELEVEADPGKRGAKADGESAVLAKIAEMPAEDGSLAERIHAIIKEVAPDLAPKTWYGMPAYAKDGNVVCFFQGAHKFKVRYSTLGFTDKAKLDDGNMWPTAFALTRLTAADEAKVRNLIKKAVT